MVGVAGRYRPALVRDNLDDSLLVWLLVLCCSPSFFNNPYLVAKLVEVLYFLNPSIQVGTAASAGSLSTDRL